MHAFKAIVNRMEADLPEKEAIESACGSSYDIASGFLSPQFGASIDWSRLLTRAVSMVKVRTTKGAKKERLALLPFPMWILSKGAKNPPGSPRGRPASARVCLIPQLS